MFISLKPLDERQGLGRRGHRPPARQAGARPRRHAVPAGRAGHAHRRPPEQRPVPVHAAEPEPRRAERLRAADAGQAARPARAARRDHRPAEPRPAGRAGDRPRHRLAPRRPRRRPSTTRSTTPSASARSRPSSPSSTSTASCWRSPPTSSRTRTRSTGVYVRSPTGAQVPLERLHALRARAPRRSPVNHQGQFPSVTLSFNLAPGVALGDAVKAIAGRRARDRAAAATLRGSFQGTAQAFQASLASQPMLILAALVAVYIVLGVLYESFIHPITILSTLPSAGVGAILALLLCQHRPQHHRADRHHPADRHREEERDHDDRLRARRRAGGRASRPRDAIYEACLLRFRPIMMTTMAALLGALAAGARHRARAPSCAGRSASPSSAA